MKSFFISRDKKLIRMFQCLRLIYLHMKFEYNLIKLFSSLPQDMIRAILEFDDTYRNTFRAEIFREQLLSLYWKQSFIETAVYRLVFSFLENIMKTRQTFMRPDNFYVIMGGRFQTKRTFTSVGDMRKDIKLILSPYKNFMRWKMVPVMDKSEYYAKQTIVWDGCIGNRLWLESDPSMFLSLFFGAGSLGGQMVKHVTPSEFGHIGDTFWF